VRRSLIELRTVASLRPIVDPTFFLRRLW